ncbi:zinc-finger homeodomain protein 4-like [Cicer arietinum]|uniref:Zinc-finger homeodomain protein 4-like n=1 Tax=Cicer arietinum TaxID=3827 RepID=A0A1S2XW48_CICAR|nr:zinc-finger homeodomain protein 4-like [Cicer arietinum]
MESRIFHVNKREEKKIVVKYKECLKNHAAAIGGNATDGCGEFMPSGETGTLEALMCCACNCHRNFHRKEIESNCDCSSPSKHYAFSLIPDNVAPILNHLSPNKSGSTSPSDHFYEKNYEYCVNEVENPTEKMIKKRSRTKFTQEQKEKMQDFAEKAGWRIQKLEESVVQKFCQEIGIKRRVLKVWMHNNKNTFAKRNLSTN